MPQGRSPTVAEPREPPLTASIATTVPPRPVDTQTRAPSGETT